MGLRDVISNLFKKNKPIDIRQAQDELLSVAMPMQPSGDRPIEMANKFKAERERKEVIESCREMYATDPRVKKMLLTLARDTLKGGFSIKTEDAKAKAIVDGLSTRLGLDQKLERYVRLSGRDGDSFLQIVINGSMDIVSMTRKPTLQMRRNSDDADILSDPRRAYWMADPMFWGMDPPSDARWFADWEIIHARWEWDEESRYGSPMMAAATGAFKKVREGETDVSVRRKVRAGQRYSHVIEGSPADVEAYKELNKLALNNPAAAIADFFSNKPGTISVIQGDAHVDEIADIKHHIATLFIGSDVPMELIGYGEGLNRDILGEKKSEYNEILRQIREWTAAEILIPLIHRAWLLKGILPESVKFEIIWRHATDLTAQDFLTITDSVLRMKILGIDDKTIARILEQQLGVDIGELTPDAGGETGRFADMLKGLSV